MVVFIDDIPTALSTGILLPGGPAGQVSGRGVGGNRWSRIVTLLGQVPDQNGASCAAGGGRRRASAQRCIARGPTSDRWHRPTDRTNHLIDDAGFVRASRSPVPRRLPHHRPPLAPWKQLDERRRAGYSRRRMSARRVCSAAMWVPLSASVMTNATMVAASAITGSANCAPGGCWGCRSRVR